MATRFSGLGSRVAEAELPVQAAAICYRVAGESAEFLLVNTSSGKWTFPKGRLNPSMSASESAAQEAWEEAGAKGRIAETHFGSYTDTKRGLGHNARTREVRILAFAFHVRSTVTPEESGRNPRWFSPREAKRQLAEGRSPRSARQIATIIDTVTEVLMVRNQRSMSLFGSQPRRFASAR